MSMFCVFVLRVDLYDMFYFSFASISVLFVRVCYVSIIYAHIEIVVAFLVVNILSFLIIAS